MTLDVVLRVVALLLKAAYQVADRTEGPYPLKRVMLLSSFLGAHVGDALLQLILFFRDHHTRQTPCLDLVFKRHGFFGRRRRGEPFVQHGHDPSGNDPASIDAEPVAEVFLCRLVHQQMRRQIARWRALWEHVHTGAVSFRHGFAHVVPEIR